MKTVRAITVGAAVLTVAFAGLAVAAEPHGRHGSGMSVGLQHGGMQHGGMGHGQGMEEHLSTLKAELKLTSAQEPAWQAFEQTVRSQRAAHGQEHGPAQAGADPMESHLAHMEQRLNGMKAVAQARQDLYQVLTPEQKAVADRFFGGRHA